MVWFFIDGEFDVLNFDLLKESGLGREGGPTGIDEYMITKTVAFGI